MSQLCKLSQLCYHFLSRFENENIFFDIPRYPPPIAVPNSLPNQFFQKNLRFCIFSTTKKIMQNWREEKGPGTLLFPSVLHNFFFCWKYTELSIYLEKLIGQWIPDRNGRGIARDIKKNNFQFQNATINGNKVGTIYKIGTFQLFKLS